MQAGTWEYHQRQYGADYDYQDFAPQFRAELFDPDHWADVFLRSGAKYVVLTSKHHEGFALWPSREASATWGRPWNAVEIGPKRDVLGDLTGAVRAKGLKMGFYYSLYEWYNPLWLADKPRYVREHVFPQFKDLVTRYEPALIFSDGEWDLPSAEWRSPELLAWLFNESKVKDDVVINDRWGKDSRHKHGGYWTTEYTPGMSGSDHPWEESRGMGFSYGYNRAERLEHYRSGRELVIMLVRHREPRRQPAARHRSRRRRHDPGRDGGAADARSASWLKVNGEAIYGTRPFTTAKQWSAGEVPKIDYDKEYETRLRRLEAHRRSRRPARPRSRRSSPRRAGDVYAILPRWPGRRFTVKDAAALDVKSVALLGRPDAAALHEDRGLDHRRAARPSGGAPGPAGLGAAPREVGRLPARGAPGGRL